MKTLRFFAVSILLSGCMGVSKVYSGSLRSEDELSRFIGHGVSIVQVDETKIGSASRAVDVLPGKHLIVVKPNAASYGLLGDPNQLLYLDVHSEAGKRYSITSKRGFRNLCAFEISEATGNPDFQSSIGCFTRR